MFCSKAAIVHLHPGVVWDGSASLTAVHHKLTFLDEPWRRCISDEAASIGVSQEKMNEKFNNESIKV